MIVVASIHFRITIQLLLPINSPTCDSHSPHRQPQACRVLRRTTTWTRAASSDACGLYRIVECDFFFHVRRYRHLVDLDLGWILFKIHILNSSQAQHIMQNDKFDHFCAFSPSVVVKFPSNQRISQRRTNSRCGIDVRPNHSVPVALVLPVPFALSLAPNVYISLTYVYDGECWAMRLYSWGSLFYVFCAIMPAQPREPARQHVYIFYLYIDIHIQYIGFIHEHESGRGVLAFLKIMVC